MTALKESDIRNREAHNRYLELVGRDAEALALHADSFVAVPCPACAGTEADRAFVKMGFTYVQCRHCETLYVNPRPRFDQLTELYADSPSTRYWVEEFFAPMAEARRVKIFRPRATFITERFPQLSRGRVADVGAGFGLFLEELGARWPHAELVAIEPSSDMAGILRAKGLVVIERMLEDLRAGDGEFDLLTAFELFEHLHEPVGFLRALRSLLRPGGFVFLTTLNGQGFDIQVQWERSKAVSPPHHLNFINPRSMTRLLDRAGFVDVVVDTPGILDWDIVEGAMENDGIDPGRFFGLVARQATPGAKAALQQWITASGFSSHLRAVARNPA
jgi:SAM-dependent methyltransferase